MLAFFMGRRAALPGRPWPMSGRRQKASLGADEAPRRARWRLVDQPSPGGCLACIGGRSVPLAEIAQHGHVLTPGRYVGDEAVADDDEDFAENKKKLTETLGEQMAKGSELDQLIRRKLGGWGMSSDKRGCIG